MNLFDILACPTCKLHVIRQKSGLHCQQCGRTYPIIDNVPVMLPDASVPVIHHEVELNTRRSYDPWVHRVILQSLLDDQIALEVGAGNMALDDPNIIRMDVKLGPHVDLVADLHSLPFLPASVDYIFSLAVFEHLRNPFEAAESIYVTLKDGGYFYHDCNFVFPYHGYPHHYFNASLQGMEQVFARFVHLKKGIAPYQMPSFALDLLLRTYLAHSQCRDFPHGARMSSLIEQLLALNSSAFDIYFTEQDALYVAAGTYIAGLKQETVDSTLVPLPVRRAWEQDQALQQRFPRMNDLSTVDNIMRWAQVEGRSASVEIAGYLDALRPFGKRGDGAPRDRTAVRSLPFVEPRYGAIGFDPSWPLAAHAQIAEGRLQASTGPNDSTTPSLLQRGLRTLRQEGLTSFLGKAAGTIGRVLRHGPR